MSTLDYGYQSSEQLDMLLNEILDRFGHDAIVVRPEVVENAYEEVALDPDVAFPSEIYYDPTFPSEGALDEPGIRCRVMLGEPIEGLLMNDLLISYSDKIETQYQIVSKVPFQYDDRVDVTFGDGREMRLRVIEVLSSHPYSAVYYKCLGVVM